MACTIVTMIALVNQTRKRKVGSKLILNQLSTQSLTRHRILFLAHVNYLAIHLARSCLYVHFVSLNILLF